MKSMIPVARFQHSRRFRQTSVFPSDLPMRNFSKVHRMQAQTLAPIRAHRRPTERISVRALLDPG